MNQSLKNILIEIAKEQLPKDDPTHDLEHALRVLRNAEEIAKEEGADLDILTPAALFHDLVNIPKNHPDALKAPDMSADEVVKILQKIPEFPQEKLANIHTAISCCSFKKGIIPSLLEAKILQDADGLEATGAISIMRTFCSTGTMNRPFYNVEDPFCTQREPNAHEYALDLFPERLLKVEGRMHTKRGKKIAKRRTKFLYSFLKEFKKELRGL